MNNKFFAMFVAAIVALAESPSFASDLRFATPLHSHTLVNDMKRRKKQEFA